MSTSPATRISTDRAARRLERGGLRFRRGLIGTIVALAIACAALGTASVLQGPRLQGAKLDVTAAVAGPALLRLVLDEAIAPIDVAQVSVTPEVPLTVQTDGDVVLIQFGRALDYETRYRLGVSGVTAVAGGAAADLEYEVATPAFTSTWLERAGEADRIVTGRPGESVETLYTGARIQDFVPLDGALLVIRLDDAGAGFADIVATDGSGNVESLALPGGSPSRIELLTLVGSNVLYTYTTLDPDAAAASNLPVFDDALFLIDLNGSHGSVPVTGIDGQTLAVDAIIPVPGASDVLLHTRAGEVLRYDPAGTAPTLLAKYSEMIALGADGHSLSVRDALGPLIYDLDDGTETRIAPSPVDGSGTVPFVADVLPLTDGRWIERVVVPIVDFSAFDSFVGLDDGSTSSELYRLPGGSILNYRLTANERYLVLEVSPGGDSLAAGDGYETDPLPRDVETVLLEVSTGKTATWPGSHATW